MDKKAQPTTPSSAVTAYIINHTHWDREWFTTSEYTSSWIRPLIDNLWRLVERNPDFRYFFDGQTLFIADLLRLEPNYRGKLQELLSRGALLAGPYYCQPDWRLSCGESLIRNLQFGIADVEQFDVAPTKIGWMVDCFGHVSQGPQIHRMFGIDTVYVWRGVPIMEPYFDWESPDGEKVAGINLLGGYRNLYGVTKFPEVAVTRLLAETQKLSPYYPDGKIPLFDGYDLDQDPEDPVLFYSAQHKQLNGSGIGIHASSPAEFANIARSNFTGARTIAGELFSGRYAGIFPGTLSIREYLKVMNHDCECALFRIAEPVRALASMRGGRYPAAMFEGLERSLLQNQVHDCICGVSVDSVHEKMEVAYRRIFEKTWSLTKSGLDRLLAGFKTGFYAVSTNSPPQDAWLRVGTQVCRVQTGGVGVFPISERLDSRQVCEPAADFAWRNDYYNASVGASGRVEVNGTQLGALVVCSDRGDTYSEELSENDRPLEAAAVPRVTERSPVHVVVSYHGAVSVGDASIGAHVELTFDRSPLIRWRICLDSKGTGFCVKLRFDTGIPGGTIRAAMPFDLVERCAEQTNLLPRQPEPSLARLLLGQRELNAIKTFPFHEMVIMDGQESSVAVFARGVRAYRAGADGSISLLVRRSVEWLTVQGLRDRQGDAGPLMYVPDARAERQVTHEVAWSAWTGGNRLERCYQWLDFFANPPLVVEHAGEGETANWPVVAEDLPLSSLFATSSSICARWHNPLREPRLLKGRYARADAAGNTAAEMIDRVMAGQIVTAVIAPSHIPGGCGKIGVNRVLNRPRWRVGKNHGSVDQRVLDEIASKIAALEAERKRLEQQTNSLSGRKMHESRHMIYVLQREQEELRLSLELNRVKMAHGGGDTAHLFEVDPVLAKINQDLNELRIKRRVYDYVIDAIRNDPSVLPPQSRQGLRPEPEAET